MNKQEKSAYNRAYRVANRAKIEARRAERRSGAAASLLRCCVVGCDDPYEAKGFCGRHYMAWRRHGNPLKVVLAQRHGIELRERMELYTVKSDGCWLWNNHRNPGGYGVVSVPGGRQRLAHRMAWQLEYGAIPKGMFVCHHCDAPACVRPDHLFLGTLAQNNADMAAKGRRRGPTGMNGIRNPNAKLTEVSVRAIRASKELLRVLSKKYGVTETTISYIRRGLIWRHVK